MRVRSPHMCPALCLHHCAVPHLNHLQATGGKTETPSFDLTKWQSHTKETSPHYSGVQGPKGQVPKLATKVKKTANQKMRTKESQTWNRRVRTAVRK